MTSSSYFALALKRKVTWGPCCDPHGHSIREPAVTVSLQRLPKLKIHGTIFELRHTAVILYVREGNKLGSGQRRSVGA
jgi:hypothetical protein